MIGSVEGLVAAALQFFAASQLLLGERWPESATITNGSRYDFIIVGAGTGGSTLATRLVQANYSVLLVEAGGYPPAEAVIPGFKHSLKGSKYDWKFTTVNDGISSQGLAYGRQLQPRGKLLGGTDSIGDMVYSRGHPEDYYEWADIVGGSWNWTNVLKYFKKTERMTDEKIINNKELMQYHGRNGEIEVSGRDELNGETNKFLEAFDELGVNIVNDMTYPYKLGVGRLSHTISNGRRASSLSTLLSNVHADNLFVLNDTLVTKIIIENQVAVGVKTIINGEQFNFYANKEVIVSAGTFNTPKLLMLSGIGPKDHLENLEIEVIQNLPVGENLHDHIMVTNFLVMDNGTCQTNTSFLYFEIVKYLYNYSGTFSYSDSVGAYLSKSGENSEAPYFAIYPTCVSPSGVTLDQCLRILGYDEATCQKIIDANQENELVPVSVVHLKPQSRGKVRLNSSDPHENPLIYSGTFNNFADFVGYVEAIKKALSIVETTHFKANNARVLDFIGDKCKALEGDDQIRCFIRDYAMPAWHSVGTAAMGTVVDAQLQVKGVDRLRVVDASVMPIIPRGNINAVVMMIAERAAHFIKYSH